MDSQSLDDENLDKGPWFPLEMRPEERRLVRNLVLATKNGHEDEVKEILESNQVDVDSKYHWESALMVASRLNNVDICKLLLDYGADCNLSRIMQQTALWIAASYGNVQVMELLVSSRKCTQENLDNALRKCVMMNFLCGCDCLLRAGASPNATDSMGFTSLHVAAGGTDDTDVPRQDNWKFQNPESWWLYHATNFETCELLIMWDADVNARCSHEATPLHFACENEEEEICNFLIENGADVNARGGVSSRTPLHVAVAKDSPKIIKLLLKQEQIQPNLKDEEGETALICATHTQKRESVRALLDDDRWPALMSVVTRREPEDEEINTPMREMIRHMPEMACYVMNKCLELSHTKDLKSPNLTARFYFAFLDDAYSSGFWDESSTDTITSRLSENRMPPITTTTLDRSFPSKGVGSRDIADNPRRGTVVGDSVRRKRNETKAPACDDCCFTCSGRFGCRLNVDVKAYTTRNRTLMNNHPLKIATKEKRYSVLCHPLSVALINHKWNRMGRYWFYGGLILHAIFVVLLNTHIMTAFPPKNTTSTNETAENPGGWIPIVTFILLSFCAVAVTVLIVSVVSDFPASVWKLENWLDIVVYVTTVCTVYEIASSTDRSEIPAAICIFTAWFSLMLAMRQFPVIGIFFVMFTRILKNSMIVLLVFAPLMIGFALTFTLITPKLPQFSTPMSFFTVLVMLSGEMEYIDSVTGPSSTSILQKEAAIAVYVTFTILMVICLLNLLVGLAVSDVESLHNQAKAEMIALKAEKVISCECLLSDIPRRRIACGCVTEQPNKSRFSFRKDGRKMKWKHRLSAWFNVYGLSTTYISPAELIKTHAQERPESETEKIGRDLSLIKICLERLASVSQRSLKSEASVGVKSPVEVPGARALRKTFGITGSKRRSQLNRPFF